MKVNDRIHFMGPKDCPFTYKGQNLVEFRLAALRPLAKAFKVKDDGTKNEVLTGLVNRLRSLEAPSELTELASLANQ